MKRALRLYDTMAGKKIPFRPTRPPRVSMFVCGPTVQSEIHIGNARTYIFFDALARYLKHLGHDVTYLMNVTDLDEQVSEAAAKAGEDPIEYSERMILAMKHDFKRLKLETVSRFEPVSHHVEESIRQTESLIDKGFAYQAGGWVYFDTSKFSRWGRLSHQSKRELSLRPLELSPMKRNLNDFALWRPEVLVKGRYKSPWGLGSPGWHIQDTAVTVPILGAQYDIHGGAYELVYPHHEAEIAQAECLTGKRPFVRHWVHTSILKQGGEKMSKSWGNVFTVREALKTFSADELRFVFLSTNYRSESGFTGTESARRRLAGMRRMTAEVGSVGETEGALDAFETTLNDDFDSPTAIDWAERTLKAAVKEGNRERAKSMAGAAVKGMKILGVDLNDDP
ncbi:MAG: class I tRNA ligase family protein [Nitrososphaerota archaeon]|nr:class I tRNA ligase family protein [Nitrososphaerota archaeon]